MWEMGVYALPMTSAFRHPVETLDRDSADLLVNMSKGNEKPKKLIYEGELLVRESTAERKRR